MTRDPSEGITLSKVETNNLKSIDITFPLGQISVVTGVSGSGKSSLVFDTLYRESYRRYLESLSSFARQFLQTFPKPKLRKVENLPPSIAVKQTRSGVNKRSTVGSLTEIHDIVQLLYSHIGELHCKRCDQKIHKFVLQELVHKILRKHNGEALMMIAPLNSWDIKPTELKTMLAAQGYTRILKHGQINHLEDESFKDLEPLSLVVDRIKIAESTKDRMIEAVVNAMKIGSGRMSIWDKDQCLYSYTQQNQCLRCDITYPQASLLLFSHNHPQGACPSCQGFGQEIKIDWNKVFKDPQGHIKNRGIAALNFGSHDSYYREIEKWAKKKHVKTEKLFKQYTEQEWKELLEGDGQSFQGMIGYFNWLDTKKYKQHYRIHRAKFSKYVTCQECSGHKHLQDALAFKIKGYDIVQVKQLSIKNLYQWAHTLEQDDVSSKNIHVAEAIKNLKERSQCLIKIGLSYLSLGREADSLSGGELQRISLARCLGSSLTETLFCLDEPTVGLHPLDTKKLINILQDIKNKGNTLVLVEHDTEIMKASDYLVTIGPGAGHEGGHRIDVGDSDHAPKRWVGECETFRGFLNLKNPRTHNLKGDDLRIPLGCLVGVCGVSGSGKTSLFQHTLYPLVAKHLGQEQGQVDEGAHVLADGVSFDGEVSFSRISLVTQAPLARSSRSNIATYLGVYSHIRKILASQALAVHKMIKPAAFSFNVAGGRCEVCRGMGTVVEDLSFLGEMELECSECNGKRFVEKVLEVKYKNKNILDILNLTVLEAREFFFEHKKITDLLDQVIEIGLGYIVLGQSTSSFSGGESQRLKLLKISQESLKGENICFLFDEPTSGLASSDVLKLVKYFKRLSGLGHSFIIIEHNLELLVNMDYLVELGPEAEKDGGQIIFQGGFKEFIKSSQSVTNKFINLEHF